MKKYPIFACLGLLVLFFVPDANAQSAICSYLTGSGAQPSGAINDNQGHVFVALFDSNEVVEIGNGCVLLASYVVPNNPMGIAFDGANIWVTQYNGNAVEKINLSRGTTNTYAVGTNPRGVVFDGTYIWVANYGSNSVTRLVAATGANAGIFNVGSGPYFMAYNPIAQTVWVANRNGASVMALNSTGVVKTIATGAEPQFVTFDGSDMWVSCYSSQEVEKFSPDGTQLLGVWAISGHGQPSGIAGNIGDFGGVWGVTHNGAVFFISPNNTLTYFTPIGDNNFDIVIDRVNSSEWVTDLDQGKIVQVSN